MSAVDLQQMEELVRELAREMGKSWIAAHEKTQRGDGRTLIIRSGTEGTGTIRLTAFEDGTVFWNLLPDFRAEWFIADVNDLAEMQRELRLMIAAVFNGAVSGRGELKCENSEFRLSRSPLLSGGLLRQRRRFYRAYRETEMS